jgi:hypothetical protein
VRRIVAAGWVFLCLASAPRAEEAVVLAEDARVGVETKTKLHLVLRGTVRIGDRDENVAGQALLVYLEKVLAVGEGGLPALVARQYEDARAKFVFGKSEDPRQLRPNVRLMVGRADDKGLTLWSPSGPLTSDELELIEDTLDTTQLAGLLPAKPVKVGDSWDPSESVQMRLCDMEQLIASTVSCKLEALDDATATLAVSGKIHGLAYGSEVKSNVQATVAYDRKQKLIARVEWKQIDSRAPSPVSPAGAYEATVRIERARAASPALADAALAGLDLEAQDAPLDLVYEDPKRRFRFFYDRQWHVTLTEPDRVILRRLVQNEMIAQLDVTVVGEDRSVAALTTEQLQQILLDAGDVRIDEIVRSESAPAAGDYDLRLVHATGKKGELELIQRHYLARDSSGRQLLFTFLTEPVHVEKLNDADRAVVDTLQFGGQTANNPPGAPR